MRVSSRPVGRGPDRSTRARAAHPGDCVIVAGEARMDLRGVGGVWPAALTPFEPDGAIDDWALAAHLEHLARTPGVSAVVVNGHAGEVTSLDRAERVHVVETARRVAGPAVGVVAGVIADDT